VAPYRILVVDDDPLIQSLISDFLLMRGYTPHCVASGAQALRLATANPPDLILLDIRMPGLTGWDVARELRARRSRVPIVVMTAAENLEEWPRVINFDAYIAKPFTLSELRATVERFCRPTSPGR
jgi:two-component system OmpR family response regulator